jgi:hypothetical protein
MKDWVLELINDIFKSGFPKLIKKHGEIENLLCINDFIPENILKISVHPVNAKILNKYKDTITFDESMDKYDIKIEWPYGGISKLKSSLEEYYKGLVKKLSNKKRSK